MSDPTNPPAVALGFLSLTQDAAGVSGGYLLTNAWGRPLEFRLSSAVQPTKMQQVLYGPTLLDYLHCELIGKTLVERAGTPPALVVCDAASGLGLAPLLNVPVVAVGAAGPDPLVHPRSSKPLLVAGDREHLLRLLESVDPAVDLAEPFARIREAAGETRKMGGATRAA